MYVLLAGVYIGYLVFICVILVVLGIQGGRNMAEAQQRVEKAVDEMVKELERNYIRKMQAKMFHCSAACCEDSTASMQHVHTCIERCHAPLAQAQAGVTSELERFQIKKKKDHLGVIGRLDWPVKRVNGRS
ncbi:protein FAM136A isoform X2 [Protopterus annectens]|uniref:protein FAM136A isoform X2 n=1 Tax=Protopterus annectens TaxID=7888 RepID=UPI001CFA677F|nr:protein FAM136A isoform X2 [Protopterus annectens]